MSQILQTLIDGVLLGALYALFGLGLSVSLGVMRMINLAHGDLIVLGAYLCSMTVTRLGLDAWLSLAVVLPAMFIIGWLLQRGILNRVVGQGVMSPLLLTFGLSIVLQNLMQELFTSDTRSVSAGAIALRGFQLGAVSLGELPLLTGGICVVAFSLAAWSLSGTHLGRMARAVADDPATARLVGVNDKRLFPILMGIIGALIGLAALLFGMRTAFTPSSGPAQLLYAFEAVVVGGLGSIWGTFFGGLLIGLSQMVGSHINSGLGPFFGHLAFLLALLARPQGLFGRSSS
ncbi:branched-chain amino acid ABC transporter permease [Thiomonas sp. FB-6]|uniref:branched-chain amino acid ABC transporter permease n=1 Tax=Thiomonas sp. FB-6 TaxID=1158291 RepID=UPI00037C2563|nr:branched-chain amino acid ABC transporter permease [Thiomonas sp. FB-6]